MSAIAKTESHKITAAKRIDAIASSAMELFKQSGSFESELAVAQAMSDLRAVLTPEVMQPIMALMNTDLGFRTDRDPKVTPRDKEGNPMTPYSVDVVRECFIESKLRGFHTIGNEWNILAGRFYAAKNGFRRKVTTYHGVTNFKDTYDVPRMVQDKGAIVKCKATWKKEGTDDSLEREFPVRVNAFMGSDAILGKAQRKLLAAVHDRLAGMITPDGDASEDIVPAPATPQPTFGEPEETSSALAPVAGLKPAKRPAPVESLTVQQELAEIVTKAGHTFDEFIVWGRESGNLTAAVIDALTGFNDLTEAEAKRFVVAKAGLLRGLAMLKGTK